MPPEHKAARSNRAGRASIAASFSQLAAIFYEAQPLPALPPLPAAAVNMRLHNNKPPTIWSGALFVPLSAYLIPKKCSMLCHIVISPVLGGTTTTTGTEGVGS